MKKCKIVFKHDYEIPQNKWKEIMPILTANITALNLSNFTLIRL